MDYPESKRVNVVETLHGVEIADPYRWLEELDSPETREWIDAQNELTFDYLARIPGRDAILERLTALYDFPKYGIPVRRGDCYFTSYNDGLQPQAVLHLLDSLEAEPRLLMDPNTLSDDGTIALAAYVPTDDGKFLAYALAEAGSDWTEWRVKDVDSGEDLDDLVKWVKFSGLGWSRDASGFFYARYDEPEEGAELSTANYYQKLHYHRLGDRQEADELVYERPDQKEWGFGPYVTEDGRYLVIQVWRGTHRENGIFYKDLTDPEGRVIELLPDFDASYSFVANSGSVFYFTTDLDAPMSRLIAIDVAGPARENWRQVIPEAADSLESVRMVGDRFLVTYLHHARSAMKVFHEDGTLEREIELPGLGTVVGISGRRADGEAFYVYQSFTTPPSIYRYDLESGESTLYRRPEVGLDPADFLTEQVFYESKDGTRIPMFLCRKRGVQPGPETPCFLYGYGGFDLAQTPGFGVSLLTWMEMGGQYAVANIRGGGEYGKTWHEGGMKLSKQNCFDDFIAAAEWLIQEGYTSTPKLAIGGGSNGGLLIGACMTQRPELFGACMPQVGVLDMLRFHKFTIGWGWTSDYGSPEEPEEFRAILAYSPYHNVKPGTSYPQTLITTGDHDDRVFPAHSFKFAAALQHAQAGDAPTLIRIETRAGHGAGKPTAKILEEQADRWAFLTKALNMDPPA